MNLNLGPEWEAYIKGKVDSGLYQSGSEVVREAMRMHWERELIFKSRLERLNDAIQVGLDAAQEGRTMSGEESYARLSELIRSYIPKAS